MAGARRRKGQVAARVPRRVPNGLWTRRSVPDTLGAMIVQILTRLVSRSADDMDPAAERTVEWQTGGGGRW